jgi:hypothetical protein
MYWTRKLLRDLIFSISTAVISSVRPLAHGKLPYHFYDVIRSFPLALRISTRFETGKQLFGHVCYFEHLRSIL